MVSRMFGCKRDKVRGEWKKLHNEKLHNLNNSPNIIRMIKSMRMEKSRTCSTHNGYQKCVYNFGRKARGEERGYTKYLDRSVILKWILLK
jgi:hypothetical protein